MRNRNSPRGRILVWAAGLTAAAAGSFAETRYYPLEQQAESTRALMAAWRAVATIAVPGERAARTLTFTNKSNATSALLSEWNDPEP